MRVQVKFFAIFREMLGVKSEAKDIPDGTTVEQLWQAYAATSPRAISVRAAYAVNQKLVPADQVLREGDVVGFLPPVSGGAGQVKSKKVKVKSNAPRGKRKAVKRKAANVKDKTSRAPEEAWITTRRLDLNVLVKRVAFPGAGAIIPFIGVVRDNSQGKPVDHLEYEAYPEMAEQALREIIAEIHERWAEVRVVIAHRIGKLKIGDASLIIAIAAPHRPEGYAASRYAIERIKAIVPVWKKEFTTDGESWVEGPVAGEIPAMQAERIALGKAG